jgi:hypothetical protein
MAWFRFRPNQRSKLQSRPRPKLPLLIAHSRVTEQVACSKSNQSRDSFSVCVEQTTIKATCLTFFWQINPKKIPLSLFYFFGEKEKETT